MHKAERRVRNASFDKYNYNFQELTLSSRFFSDSDLAAFGCLQHLHINFNQLSDLQVKWQIWGVLKTEYKTPKK